MIILSLGEEAPLITPYQNTHFSTELGVGRLNIRGNPHHTRRQKIWIFAGSAMEGRREQSLWCQNLSFRKPPLIPTLLGRQTKKKNKKAQPHSLLPFPHVSSMSQFPTELQFHTSHRWLSQLHKRQTDGYRTIPSSAHAGLTSLACVSAHTIRHRAIKAVWSLLRFPRWQNADINSWQLL